MPAKDSQPRDDQSGKDDDDSHDNNRDEGGRSEGHDNESQSSSPSDLGKKEKKSTLGEDNHLPLEQTKSEKSTASTESPRSLGQSVTKKSTENAAAIPDKVAPEDSDKQPVKPTEDSARIRCNTPIPTVADSAVNYVKSKTQTAGQTVATVSGSAKVGAIALSGVLKNLGKGKSAAELVEAGGAAVVAAVELAITLPGAIVSGAAAVATGAVAVMDQHAADMHEADMQSQHCRDLQKAYFDRKLK